MNKNISLYPTFDEIMFEKTSPIINYEFKYEEGIISHYIEGNKTITLDNESLFDRDLDDLVVQITLTMSNLNLLFGIDGISPKNSKIGFFAEIYSQKSKYRQCVKAIEEISSLSNETTTTFSFTIPAGRIEGSVEINVGLFLSKSDNLINEEESFLNNQAGTILGFLDKKILYLHGFGSIFPIINKATSDEKLWDLIINYEDPFIDLFCDSIQLIINSSHDDYVYLDENSQSFCKPLIFEIVAQALSIIISKIKSEGYLEEDRPTTPGSIMEFIDYLKDMVHIDFTDMETISSSLRNYLSGGK